MPNPADDLLAAVLDSALLESPTAHDDLVSGRAHLPAAVADVDVVVDPDGAEVDPDSLVTGLSDILDITESEWTDLVDEIADELDDEADDATDESDGETSAEAVDLRDDLTITTLRVLPDAALLTFAAPKRFPDSWIRVQLDADLEIEDLQVDERED